jgi:hypothetical protein
VSSERPGVFCGFGLADAIDQCRVTVGVRGVLVGRQILGPPLDHLIQALRQLIAPRDPISSGCGGLLDRREIMGGAPSPQESARIRLHRDAVFFDRH